MTREEKRENKNTDRKFRNHAFNLKREIQLFNDLADVSLCERCLKHFNSMIFSLSIPKNNQNSTVQHRYKNTMYGFDTVNSSSQLLFNRRSSRRKKSVYKIDRFLFRKKILTDNFMFMESKMKTEKKTKPAVSRFEICARLKFEIPLIFFLSSLLFRYRLKKN